VKKRVTKRGETKEGTLVEIHREISANSCKVLSVTGRNSQLEEEAPAACMKVGRE